MEKCDECGAELPAHYGSCSQVPAEIKAVFAELEASRTYYVQEQSDGYLHAVFRDGDGRGGGGVGPIGRVARVTARQQGKTLELARRRVRQVAEGGTINGTYRLSPEPALEAFRADLLLILGP